MTLLDSHGRQINYLRLSVTDRCNLRCTYCMPATGTHKLDHGDILSYEALLQIATAAVSIGVRKIRITGGEPLVRRGIIDFIQRLSVIPALERLVLTTNGILLPQMAEQLYTAGVESLNISLDSLNPETFATITRGGDLSQVLDGIKAAEAAGFRHIKINVVVMRGVNDNEVEDFAALTIKNSYRVRFIEYMPTLAESGWESKVVPGDEIIARLSQKFRLFTEAPDKIAGPARYHRIEGAAGLLGVITPLSCNFCNNCNRIRVTSRGMAKSCLFDHGRTDLRPFLAEGDNERLTEAIRRVVSEKPDRHQLAGNAATHNQMVMAQIGG
jgi:cyclic pyranopterin phosphate synthase